MSAAIAVAAVGWDHPGWCDRFYPDDLPPEWRLTYYGNEFLQVLVPADRWWGVQAPWEQWREDVDPSFRFVLEIGNAAQLSGSGVQWLGTAAEILGRQLAGAVSWRPLEGEGAAALRRILGPERFLAQAGSEAGEGCRLAAGDGVVCGEVESVRAADLRWLRGLMESVQGAPGGEAGRWLFIRGAPPEIEVIRRAVILQQLLAGGG